MGAEMLQDEPPEPGAPAPTPPPPQMPPAPLPADGPAPAPGEVVSMADAKRKRSGAKAAAPAAKATPNAPAPGKGDGGGKPAAGGKVGKTVDWTKFNFLLANFALIYSTDTVWDGQNRLIMKIAAMAHAHGADMVRLWKASEIRRTVMPQDVVFDPTETCDPARCVNLYGGIALKPAAGDVAPFLELVRYLTSRASEHADEADEIFHYLLCWLAYPLQHPGAKLKTAVVMHGDEGAGKNFLFDTIVMIYGEYGATVGQDELEDKFNDWRSRKLFVVGDEVSSRQELVHNKNKLKALITSTTVLINPKNLPRREEANHINIVFLSNELQPQALDNTDRRYLVVYTPPAREVSFYQQLAAWRRKGGVAALYQYLLEYPLKDFDPYAPAPKTQAKDDLIDLNRKSPERFWREWSANELDLPYHTCSTAQAYQAYLKYCQRTGDRFPAQRPVFMRMLMRMSQTEKRPVREKVFKVETMGSQKAKRMLLVTEPPDGVALGEWASDCVRAFEEHLKGFIGYIPRSPLDGGKGGGE